MVNMNSGRMKREIIILVITMNEKNVDIEKSAETVTSLRIVELKCVLCVLILNGYHNIPLKRIYIEKNNVMAWWILLLKY